MFVLFELMLVMLFDLLVIFCSSFLLFPFECESVKSA